jgi:hypothetical protein
MAINKRTSTPAKKAAPAADVAEGITNVTVGRSFTIPGEGEYESQKVSVLVSAPTYEEASAAVDSFMVTEFEKSSEQFAQFRAASDAAADEVGTDTSDELEEGEEEAEGEEGEGEEEGDITEEDIRAMDRKTLSAFISENDIEVDPADYAKTKSGTKEMAEAVIEALTEPEEGEDGEEDEDGEEAEEDGEEEAEGEEEEAEIDEDAIRAMDRSELIAFNKENSLGVKTKEFPKLKALQDAIIEALTPEEDEGEEEAEEEPDEDGEGEEDDDSNAGYTRKELEAMKPKDLQAIYKGWGIKDKFPTGSEPIIRKKAVNRIMQYQETGK